MLTQKQYDLLQYINNYMKTHGVSPSFDEMRDGLALKSKSGIHRLIGGLEERGFIRRLTNRARAVEILKLPENTNRNELPLRNRRIDSMRQAEWGGGLPRQQHQGQHHILRGQMARGVGQMVAQLPLYGRIAAGTPIEALRDESLMVDVPATMLGKGEHYALEVEGDSMVEAGILDGDTVVIERCERASRGDIIVALIEQEEATLKRYRSEGGMVYLEPANRHYQTKCFREDQVEVQGRLVGLMRKY